MDTRTVLSLDFAQGFQPGAVVVKEAVYPLMIPCHRVVGTSGSLTGYGGGIARKVKLLELEHADMRGLFVPKTGTAL